MACGIVLVHGHPGRRGSAATRSHIWVGGLLLDRRRAAGSSTSPAAVPGLDAPTDDLVHAGGLLGVAVAGPLAAGLAPWGAGLLLGTVALAGLVVLTRVPVRVAAESTAAGIRPAGTAISAYLRQADDTLFSLGGDTGRCVDESGVRVFDQDVDDLD